MATIAILCSDIHLCHVCPQARSAEPNWYDAMTRMLDQLDSLQRNLRVPVLCAGDVFDRWNSPPELINFAHNHLPKMVAVPGQHDLPNHSLDEIKRSAFWTLCEMGTIEFRDLCLVGDWLRVHSFPWGTEPFNMVPEDSETNIALCHRYVWMRGKGYEGADRSQMVENVEARGWDVIVFGDNHQAFECRRGPFSKARIVNPGCLIRRRQNERKEKPGVYLLQEDFTVKRHDFDTSEDCWADADDLSAPDFDAVDFLDELKGLDADSLDFRTAVQIYCRANAVSDRVVRRILESMGENE